MDAKGTATLENGGYDYNFVQQPLPDRLVCKICQYPCGGAQMSLCCGHVFCESCLQRAVTVNNTCPMCRKGSSEFQTFANKAIDREIKELRILCTNQLKGCKWQGELSNINSHLGKNDGCEFEEMTCSNECGKMIERRYLTSHVETECPCREAYCQYCHDRGEHEFIEGQHKEVCPKLLLACPNKCEVGTVPREDMEAHRNECPLEMIQCEYHNVGCEVRMARKDKSSHDEEMIKHHLSLTRKDAIQTKEQLQSTISKLEERLNFLQCGITAANAQSIWSITEACPIPKVPVILKVTNAMLLHKQGWVSPIFLDEQMHKLCLHVTVADYEHTEGPHLSVCLRETNASDVAGDTSDVARDASFEIGLLSQVANKDHCKRNVCLNVESYFIPHTELFVGDHQYLKGDCLYFVVSIAKRKGQREHIEYRKKKN